VGGEGVGTSVTAIVGAQFGDEAKGKITDFLASRARYVVRTAGGPNAGHTVRLPEAEVILHQVSCGVLRAGVTGISGPGMVIDPDRLEEEIRDLQERHLMKGQLIISERAHVLLPIHRIEDAWEEDLRTSRSGSGGLGTTLRGIGPAYSDRVGRWGIRWVDLLHPHILSRRLELLYAAKSHLTNLPPREDLMEKLTQTGARLAPYIQPTEPLLWNAASQNEGIILEGAQSALLDIDFGTYPYVTSSHPTSAGGLVGSGLPPQELDEVVGVAKAYATRVGAGPFPTEVTGEMEDFLRRTGGEHGATTGRPRRTGWLDLVLLRYASRLNGFTSLALTKVDVLGGLDHIPVCIRYETPSGQALTDYPPVDAEELEKARPIYEELPGWPEFSSRLKERLRREGLKALPSSLRRFVDFIREQTDVPVEYVSYGASRDETLRLSRSSVSPRRAPRPWPG
jgi:adenylosuccinate synthase